MSFNHALRRFGLGKLVLRFWHAPTARVRDSLRNGGPLVERVTERHRREMEAAALKLPPLVERSAAPNVTLHILTGRRYWYQSAFCLHSFSRQAEVNLAVELYDDGTFDDALRNTVRRFGPNIRLHSTREIRERLDEVLPESRFPNLRERWRNYPNIRKLIDPHLGSRGWKLTIDSDLLFFRTPEFIIDWCSAPDRPLHAVDCEENYGYSRSLMARLAGAAIPTRLNVGLCGLRSEDIDWEQIESWCCELITRERTNYYLEQALVAMLVAGQTCAVAPAGDYVTHPSKLEALAPTAVMHHYVAGSKRWYFQRNWRRFVSPE